MPVITKKIRVVLFFMLLGSLLLPLSSCSQSIITSGQSAMQNSYAIDYFKISDWQSHVFLLSFLWPIFFITLYFRSKKKKLRTISWCIEPLVALYAFVMIYAHTCVLGTPLAGAYLSMTANTGLFAVWLTELIGRGRLKNFVLMRFLGIWLALVVLCLSLWVYRPLLEKQQSIESIVHSLNVQETNPINQLNAPNDKQEILKFKTYMEETYDCLSPLAYLEIELSDQIKQQIKELHDFAKEAYSIYRSEKNYINNYNVDVNAQIGQINNTLVVELDVVANELQEKIMFWNVVFLILCIWSIFIFWGGDLYFLAIRIKKHSKETKQ